jgi:ABC-type hemin transport system substrate-binding protein
VRVVSLVPSATETLLAVGADVVACTRFCEQPDLTHVGGTKNPDVAAIVALAPDLVVLDEEENRREDAAALAAAGLSLLVTAVRDVDGALDAVRRLSAAVGRPAPALEVPPGDPAPVGRAFVPIWRRPWMTVNRDTYGASLLRRLGVDTVTAEHPERYPSVELSAIDAPDLVLVPSEPYAFTAAHVADLAAAFPAAAVVRVDGQDLFWWGVRTPGALTRLGDAIRSAPPPG